MSLTPKQKKFYTIFIKTLQNDEKFLAFKRLCNVSKNKQTQINNKIQNVTWNDTDPLNGGLDLTYLWTNLAKDFDYFNKISSLSSGIKQKDKIALHFQKIINQFNLHVKIINVNLEELKKNNVHSTESDIHNATWFCYYYNLFIKNVANACIFASKELKLGPVYGPMVYLKFLKPGSPNSPEEKSSNSSSSSSPNSPEKKSILVSPRTSDSSDSAQQRLLQEYENLIQNQEHKSPASSSSPNSPEEKLIMVSPRTSDSSSSSSPNSPEEKSIMVSPRTKGSPGAITSKPSTTDITPGTTPGAIDPSLPETPAGTIRPKRVNIHLPLKLFCLLCIVASIILILVMLVSSKSTCTTRPWISTNGIEREIYNRIYHTFKQTL